MRVGSKRLFIVLVYFAIAGFPSASETKKSSKLFIVDASGSMNEYLGIYQKMHLAKKHVSRYIASLPAETEIGFLAYGNRIPGCSSSRLYHPLEPENRKDFKNRLFGLTPSGATPLAESIRIAGTIAAGKKEKVEIILVTDGVESCYGDPKKELQTLKKQKIPFRFHILGLGLKSNEEQQMKILSEEGGGRYFGIEDDSSFHIALDSLNENESTAFSQTKETFKDRKRGMIWFEKIDKELETESKISYTIEFGFKTGADKYSKNCIILNLKNSSGKTGAVLGSKRISSPESIIVNQSSCFDLSESKGKFTLEIPKQNGLSGVLELWDMTEVPSPLDVTEEEELR
ncbi:VWA domain-containing protein [Leptospira gomenensis]|uniref:VWA domain-containing protein n=1 Tax=Leptospira gomenensis TaxID=2484974 RepID=A0A5F1Y6F5_9LEPT|nr:VWA domain-containing protein [Leptospira gomenensis]TGK28774.1 VWA domain-containing protein [Leptospira gomenensis]TGK37639.1 VWA domain-containing protein [Leptospira gomenensis]TGK51532.1 VWA domain-containing protein [Leptospira gomenensis]TGK68089.1 VWA domain-containing protein [Leptospira gomenensis]